MNKNEEQQKPKKTTEEKRIIATNIMIGCFAAMVLSSAPAMIMRSGCDKDIRVLDDKQNAIYEQFMACEEFSDSFKQEFTKVSNDYANGVITYEEFDKKVQHLNSIKYAKEVLESSNNTELKEKVEDIKQQKQERAEKFNSNVVANISTGATLTSATGVMGSLLAAMIYTGKEFKEDKRKKKLLTNLPNGVLSIKSKNHYTSVDRLWVDDEKKGSEIKGIRYYDSNSGTIRDTADPSYEERVLNVPSHNEKHGVIRMLNNEDIEEQTETEENGSKL